MASQFLQRPLQNILPIFSLPPLPAGVMGFYYSVITVPKPISLTFLLNILARFSFLLTGALVRLGLRNPPPPAEEAEDSDSGGDCILILQGSSPSLVPIPFRVVAAAIKARVPVIRYGDFLRRSGAEPRREKACSICLERIEWTDEIREPCICNHPFHRACLDGWIDVGRVNCPLCRAVLLPPEINLFTCMRDYRDGVIQ